MKKNNLRNTLKEYCTGCGLCKAVNGVIINVDKKGFGSPQLSDKDLHLCSLVCPASGFATRNYLDGTIWGKYKRSVLAWSNDEDIRFRASSGGIITALCLFLIREHLVDGIISTCKHPDDFRCTLTRVNHTEQELLECMGSRYTTSAPLTDILNLIKGNETYAFVGKPCDVSSLRIYIDHVNPEIGKSVKYLFSFFCAGQPSLVANNQLLTALDVGDLKDCDDFQYRGNGWPGNVVLTFKNGTTSTMEYEKAWMSILGRDVKKICRYCADGTGELADISCGDAWYLSDKGKPVFDDKPGRNIVFLRTKEGADLFDKLIDSNDVSALDCDVDKVLLKQMQPYHYTRKSSLSAYKMAQRVCGKRFPLYDNAILRQFSKGFSLKQLILRFCGTIYRILKGSL